MTSSKRVRFWGLVLPIILVFFSMVLPLPNGLTRSGLYSIAILFSGICIWLCGSLPEGLSCILLTATAAVLGIDSVGTLFSKFGSTTFFFIMAMFAVTAALEKTTIPSRIVSTILKLTKKNSSLLVLGFMCGCAMLAAVMSSHMACCALFAKLADSVIRNKDQVTAIKTRYPRLAKCLMLGVAYGAGIGGFATTTSTAANLLAADILSSTLGITVRYVDWIFIGVPICLLSLVVCWFTLILIFPPEPLSKTDLETQTTETNGKEPLSLDEKKVLMIVAAMLFFWILSSWVSQINTLVVAICGMSLLFLPGIQILDWKTFSKETNWNTIFFIGGVSAIIYCVTSSGASDWIVMLLTSRLSGLPAFVVYLSAAVCAWLLHAFIPMSSGIITMLAIPFIGIGQATGVNPAFLLIIICYWAGFAILLPFDAVLMLSYRYGYYTIKDMVKCAIAPSVILSVAVSVLVPLLGNICMC